MPYAASTRSVSLVARLVVGAIAVSVVLAGCSRAEPAAGTSAVTTSSDAPRAGASSTPRAAGSTAAPGGGSRMPAAAVLHAWDEARARAFAAGDVAALRRLYVDGSRAGAADVGVLRSYLRRGLRVERMRMQILALEVLDEGPRRLRLRVTDRLAEADVVGGGGQATLPRDGASTRVVTLVRAGGGRWLVVSVRG